MNQDQSNNFVADTQHAIGQTSPQEVDFTRTEWQRLAFLRWLYRTGRLTEWPEGGAGR